jgi:hypothetical protein
MQSFFSQLLAPWSRVRGIPPLRGCKKGGLPEEDFVIELVRQNTGGGQESANPKLQVPDFKFPQGLTPLIRPFTDDTDH